MSRGSPFGDAVRRLRRPVDTEQSHDLQITQTGAELPADRYEDQVSCAIRKWDLGTSTCPHVDCGPCPSMRRWLALQRTHEWLCWHCRPLRAEYTLVPFWIDGVCPHCQKENLLCLAVVPA